MLIELRQRDHLRAQLPRDRAFLRAVQHRAEREGKNRERSFKPRSTASFNSAAVDSPPRRALHRRGVRSFSPSVERISVIVKRPPASLSPQSPPENVLERAIGRPSRRARALERRRCLATSRRWVPHNRRWRDRPVPGVSIHAGPRPVGIPRTRNSVQERRGLEVQFQELRLLRERESNPRPTQYRRPFSEARVNHVRIRLPKRTPSTSLLEAQHSIYCRSSAAALARAARLSACGGSPKSRRKARRIRSGSAKPV